VTRLRKFMNFPKQTDKHMSTIFEHYRHPSISTLVLCCRFPLWPFLSFHAFLFEPLIKVIGKIKAKVYASLRNDLYLRESHERTARRDMSQFCPLAAKENSRRTQEKLHLKHKAVCPDLRVDICFLRGTAQFCCCCVLAPTALRR